MPGKKGFFSYLKEKQFSVYPTRGVRWFVLFLIVIAWSVEQFERVKISPVLVYVINDFHWSLKGWGLVAAVAAIIGAIPAFFFGILSDRFGRRNLILWPILLYVPIAFFSARAESWQSFSLLYIIGAIVVSGMFPAAAAAMRDFSPRMGRASSYAFLSLSYVFGALLSLQFASWFLPVWPGWRPQFYLAALVGVVAFIVLLVFFRDLSPTLRSKVIENQAQGEKAAKEGSNEDLKQAAKSGIKVLRYPRIWILAFAMFFWGIAYYTFTTYLPIYLTQYFGMEPTKAATMASIYYLVTLISVPFSGWLSDRLNLRKPIILFGAIMTGFGMLWFAKLPQNASDTAIISAWLVVGFFAGFIYATWLALLSENAEEISPFGVGTAFGLQQTWGIFTGVVLNLGLPQVVGRWGWPTWWIIMMFCIWGIGLTLIPAKGPWYHKRTVAESSKAKSQL